MEDLAAQLATSFQVSNEPNTTAAPHPRFCEYKSKTIGLADQEVRRKTMLDHQKKKRFDYQSHVRRLAEDIWDDLSEDDEGEAMEVQYTKTKFRKPGRNYRNQLMLSEWMIELPENFENEWIMMPCPVGKRNLVVASFGETCSYSKGGWLIEKFNSRLPGGSKSMPKWNSESAVLDCIYNEVTKTFYVLDMMCWKNFPLYDTETEFRFYWMHDKLSEYPELKKITKSNKFRFEALPNFSCNKENITNVLSSKMNVDLDGLLFYHKKTFYTFGTTPLVTWLKGYMLPDIINCEVPSHYMALKPSTYSTFEAHVEQVKLDKEKEDKKKAKQEEKKKNRNRRSHGSHNTSSASMDTTLSPEKPKENIDTEKSKESDKMESEIQPTKDTECDINGVNKAKDSKLVEVPSKDVLDKTNQ